MKIETLTSPNSQISLTNPDICVTIDQSAPRANYSCITKISPGVKDSNRVNIYIIPPLAPSTDSQSSPTRFPKRPSHSPKERFFCSLDISQLVDLQIKVGQPLTPEKLEEIKRASDFGKFYTRALEYTLSRPHSAKEIRDYLNKKTQPRLLRIKNPKTNTYETIKKPGYDKSLVQPVLDRLAQKGHIDDQKFTEFWIENRFRTKGVSRRRLEQELLKKGINRAIISQSFQDSPRDESAELAKILAKKSPKYQNDPQKLIQYLVRQGFDYESVRTAVLETDSQN